MSASRATLPNHDGFDQRLEAALKARIGADRYVLWFSHIAVVRRGGEVLVVTPHESSLDWFRKTFAATIQSAAREVSGEPLGLQFLIDPEFIEAHQGRAAPGANSPAAEPAIASETRPSTPAVAPTAEASAATTTQATRSSTSPPTAVPQVNLPAKQLNLFGETERPLPAKPRRGDRRHPSHGTPRRFRTLQDFVVGRCNQMAYEVAKEVIRQPQPDFRCLVLYGPVGTGKTHLLEAIYSGLRTQASDHRVTFVTAEDFTTRFVQSTRFQKQASFRRTFRDCDVLLVDDLHFLAKKTQTQAEFLNTFESLTNDGRLVVLTMDCHPRQADELMPELRDRLLGAAAWSLDRPDAATRLDLLRRKAGPQAAALPEELLQFLAQQLTGNIRELEGAMNMLKHTARILRKPLTIQAARDVLGDLLRHSVRAVTLEEIDAAVRSVLHLPPLTLQSTQRTMIVTRSRTIAIYLARKHTTATYNEIAQYFHIKTHSTAVAAEKKVRGWLEANESLKLGTRSWSVQDLIDRVERTLLQ